MSASPPLQRLEAPFAEALRRFEAVVTGAASAEGDGPPHVALFREYTRLCQVALEAVEVELSTPQGDRLTVDARRVKQDEATVLRAERNTWYLLEWLYQDWPHAPSPVDLPVRDATSLSWGCGDEQAEVDALFEEDTSLAVAHAVVQWLESVAYERVDVVLHQDAFHRNTLFRLVAGLDTAGLVTEVDPDAVSRTGLALDPEDEEEERRLLQSAWQLVRAGRLDRAQELCDACGQPWRAASLNGGQLWQRSADPAQRAHGALNAVPGEGNGSVDGWSGNPHRHVWLESCEHLAKRAEDAYERALYGALCGDAGAMLGVATSWQDHAWARLKALVHSCVEGRLRAARAKSGGAAAAGGGLSELQVEVALAGGEGEDTRVLEDMASGEEERSPVLSAHTDVQRILVIDRLRRCGGRLEGKAAELCAELEKRTAGAAGRMPVAHHLARFGAHALLFLRHAAAIDARAAGSPPPPTVSPARSLGSAYAQALVHDVAQLVTAGEDHPVMLAETVALHASKLEAEAAKDVMRAFLRRFSATLSPQEQLACLGAAAPLLGTTLSHATCAAAHDLLQWWPEAVAAAEAMGVPGAGERPRVFAALHWLTLQVPDESDDLARARMVHALVLANQVTADMVQRGLVNTLLVRADEDVEGGAGGVGSRDAGAVQALAPGGVGLEVGEGDVRPRVELALPAARVNELWTADGARLEGHTEEAAGPGWDGIGQDTSPGTDAMDQDGQAPPRHHQPSLNAHRVNNAVAEFYSWAAYLQALCAYHKWWSFVCVHPDPARTAGGALENEEWRSQLLEHAESAAAALEDALHTPHGWLEDHHDGGVPGTGPACALTEPSPEATAQREAQLARLRAQCVPELVELLHSLLLHTARLDTNEAYATRSLHHIAELVADEHYRLYANFEPARLRSLLALLRKSALEALKLQATV